MLNGSPGDCVPGWNSRGGSFGGHLSKGCARALTTPALLSRPSVHPSGARREKDGTNYFFPLSLAGVGGGPGEGSGVRVFRRHHPRQPLLPVLAHFRRIGEGLAVALHGAEG